MTMETIIDQPLLNRLNQLFRFSPPGPGRPAEAFADNAVDVLEPDRGKGGEEEEVVEEAPPRLTMGMRIAMFRPPRPSSLDERCGGTGGAEGSWAIIDPFVPVDDGAPAVVGAGSAKR